MTVVGEGAEVVGVDVDQALSASAAEDAELQWAAEEDGKDGEDVKGQSVSFPRRRGTPLPLLYFLSLLFCSVYPVCFR
jgi:hypothetical protein